MMYKGSSLSSLGGQLSVGLTEGRPSGSVAQKEMNEKKVLKCSSTEEIAVEGGGPQTKKYMSFALLTFLGLVAMFGPVQGTMYTVAVRDIQETFNASLAIVGLTLSIFLWCAAIGPIPTGPAADHFGRRPVLMVGLAFFILGSFLCATSSTVWELLAWRAVQGLGYAICSVIPSTVVSDMVPKEEKGSYIGIIWFYIFLGPGIGPLLGGYMTEYFGWRSNFIFLGAWSSLMMLWCPLQLKETKGLNCDQRTQKPKSSNSKLQAITMLRDMQVARPVLCGSLLFGTLWGTSFLYPQILYDVYGYPPSVVGIMIILRSVGAMLGTILTRRLNDKIGPKPVAKLTAVFTSIFCIMMGATVGEHISSVLVALFCFGFTAASCLGAVESLLVKEFPGKAPFVVACLQFSIKIVAAIFVTVIGAVVEKAGYQLILYTLGIVCFCGSIPIMFCDKRVEAANDPEKPDIGMSSVAKENIKEDKCGIDEIRNEATSS